MKQALLKIRNLRKQCGMSQSELAERIGMSVTAFGKIERGETRLNSEHVSRIAAVLEVPEEKIWFGNTYEEEAALRENCFKDNLVKSLREEIRALTAEKERLETENGELRLALKDARDKYQFYQQLHGVDERHPSSD